MGHFRNSRCFAHAGRSEKYKPGIFGWKKPLYFKVTLYTVFQAVERFLRSLQQKHSKLGINSLPYEQIKKPLLVLSYSERGDNRTQRIFQITDLLSESSYFFQQVPHFRSKRLFRRLRR